MACGRNQPDLVGVNLHDLQLLLLHRQLGKSEISEVIQDSADDAGAIRPIYMQLNVGELLLILRKDRGQDVDTSGLIRRDYEFAARDALEFVDYFLRTAAKLKNLFSVFAENLPCRSQRDPRSQAFEESAVELLLELPDLSADRRLGSIASLRSFGKAF
jgi:hypothetical protein